MAHLVAARLKGGDIAGDGSTLDIVVGTSDGEEHTLTLPFDQAVWLSQALLSLTNELHERQTAHGSALRTPHLDAAMIAEGVQINLNETASAALIQIVGRRDPQAPLGSGSFRIDGAERLRAFATKCLEVADKMTPSSLPS